MVDENLIKELKELRDKGARQPSDALKTYEFVKQLAEENEELKEELEDIDLTVIQIVITDLDYKYWLKLGEGKLDYGEGEGEDPSVTMSATGATWAGMATGEIEGTSAYMAGDLQIEGNLQDAIAFGEITSLAQELGAEYFE